MAIVSPGPKAGSGLKLLCGDAEQIIIDGISRPKSRERIETRDSAARDLSWCVSPGPKAGSGLKHE